MAGSDPVDTHGHTRTIAALQEPLLNVATAPASQTQPTPHVVDGNDDVMVLAQSAAEVTAQITNPT